MLKIPPILSLLFAQVLLISSLSGQTSKAPFFQTLIQQHGIPGISIAVIEDGKVSYNAAHGVKATDTQAPVDRQTVFSAASLSKPVFAYAVMKLVEAGKIDLDTPLYQYLAYEDLLYDERNKLITTRMVLSHSSGLPNWRRGGKLAFLFEPGSQYQYSGEGFVYLMKVVEHLEGKEINQVLEALVFQPLGMTRSSYIWKERFEANYAPPHDFTGFTLPKRKRSSGNVAYSLQTTAEDYAKFMLAVMQVQGLKQQTLAEMLRPQIPVPDWEQLHWGLGWGLQQTPKGKAIWQWGDNGTYKAFTLSYPATKQGLVFLSNSENGMRIVPELIQYLFEDESPAFGMIDYRLEDAPYQALLKEILNKGYAKAIPTYLHENQLHHDTARISENHMRRVGYHLMRERRSADAKQAYFSNVQAYQSLDAYLQYADCCLRSGDQTEAKTYYQKAQALAPDDPSIQTILSQLTPDAIPANVIFRLRQTNYMYANLITVAGDFNNWEPLTHPFVKQNGEWVCKLKLAPGTYQYKFVIDGVWTLDPNNPKVDWDEGENVNSVWVVE